MSRAIDMIREGSALLNTEIVTLVRSGQMMNTEDSVFGYVIEPENNSMMEVEVRSLAIVKDELYAFMTETEDIDYSEEEALGMLKEKENRFLPGWFVLDEGFYGLLLPTLINIRDAFECQQYTEQYEDRCNNKITWPMVRLAGRRQGNGIGRFDGAAALRACE